MVIECENQNESKIRYLVSKKILRITCSLVIYFFSFYTDTPTTKIYTLSLHDALPIYTLGASLNIRHNLSSSKGPKPLQLKLLTTYIPKTSAFTLAFSTSQRLRTTRASARTFFTFRHYITPSARNF